MHNQTFYEVSMHLCMTSSVRYAVSYCDILHVAHHKYIYIERGERDINRERLYLQ